MRNFETGLDKKMNGRHKTKLGWNYIISLFLLGSVDMIEDGVASVEITTDSYEIVYTSLPVDIFPCEIEEGDMFYFLYANEVTEIRCGEPQE